MTSEQVRRFGQTDCGRPSGAPASGASRLWLVVLAAGLGLAAGGPAAAQTETTEDTERPIISFTLENDLFANLDRHYTSGVRLSYMPSRTAIPGWARWIAEGFPLFPESRELRVSYVIGQSLFTPREITLDPPDPNDRPYAGWLYGSVLVTAWNERQMDRLSLSLGIVGPAALGEETQSFVHRITGSDQPEGWDFQLENEPGIILSYDRQWRGLLEGEVLGLDYDARPHAGVALGNVFTYGAVGGMVRLGQRLPVDAGPPRIEPALPGTAFFLPSEGTIDWYLFGGVEGRAVARNIFLDGNTFTDSPSVGRNVLVGDAQAGVAVTIGTVRLAYTHVFRTKEFEGQQDPDSFGSFSISVRF